MKKHTPYLLILATLSHTTAHTEGMVTTPVSPGELIDKITILQKKSELFTGDKKKNVDFELETLCTTRDSFVAPSDELTKLTNQLSTINRKLWDIEDNIRDKERKQEFDKTFIEIARSVYYTNDERCKIKRAINDLCGSSIIEEKSYTDYKITNTTKNGSIPSTQERINEHLQAGNHALSNREKKGAIEHFREVLKQHSNNPQALIMLGSTHHRAGEYSHAKTYYQEFLEKVSYNQTIANNLFAALLMSGEFDDAKKMAHALYEHEPNETNKVRLLAVYCREGNWEEASKYITMGRYWHPGQDIARKHVLVKVPFELGNIGFGDIFQFIRYAKQLKQAGAQVDVLINKANLRPLLSQCSYIDRIVMHDEDLPTYDAAYPLSIFAMMLCLKDEAVDNAADIPYMHADQKLVDQWENKLSQEKRFKVGLFWQRGFVRDYFSNAAVPCPRSMTLHQLKSLGTVPNVVFYNLQKDAVHPSTIPAGFPLVQFDSTFDTEHGSFMDTAAVIKNLDLVITTDSSVAHLAGALGAPVWLMLPTSSCYRWFKDRSDCPYYPTMRLFRQQECGKWQSVVEQVHQELVKVLS